MGKECVWGESVGKTILNKFDMRRLVFIVEGLSEVRFVKDLLIPYLAAERGLSKYYMSVQQITTNRKRNIHGGNVSFGKFSNEVRKVAAQGRVMITTLIDLFRLPSDFPKHDSGDVDAIECQIRDALRQDVPPSVFLPYIQRHEFEALLFSNMDGFSSIVDDQDALLKLAAIVSEYRNPEDINGGAETAPSKRLEKIFRYEKVIDSYSILSRIPVAVIREKCPRFNRWLEQIETGLVRGQFD